MASKNGGGTNWSLIIAGGAVIITLVANLLSFITGGNEKLEKRVGNIEQDLAWKFVSKEIAAKDIGFIERNITELKTSKVDRDVYEMQVTSYTRQISILREHLKELDRSVNQTFNARDAMAALQARILELERATRK